MRPLNRYTTTVATPSSRTMTTVMRTSLYVARAEARSEVVKGRGSPREHVQAAYLAASKAKLVEFAAVGELKTRMNKAIDSMKADGSLNAMIRKWFGADAQTF